MTDSTDWACFLCGFGGPYPGRPPIEGSERGYTHAPWCDGTGRWADGWRATRRALTTRTLPPSPKPRGPRPKPAADYPPAPSLRVVTRRPPKVTTPEPDAAGRFQCDQCRCVPFHTAKGLETHKSLFHELTPAW